MTVGVGTGGQIEVYNHAGTVNVDVDVDGYYTGDGGTGSVLRADHAGPRGRHPHGQPGGTGTPIAANTSESFNLATTASGIPADRHCRGGQLHGGCRRRPWLPHGLPDVRHDEPGRL